MNKILELREKRAKAWENAKNFLDSRKSSNGFISDEDNIAFPYGKNLREGVKTKISEDDSEMIY